MVVAQIPLWIQHSSSSSSLKNKTNLPTTPSSSSPTIPLLEAWSNVRRSAIYALDISHNRIATGGGDGKVRIWNSSALFASSKLDPRNKEKQLGTFRKGGGYESSDASDQEQQPSSDRLLSVIAAHSGSVLTVRFSTSGKVLASAGDDAHVLLFMQSSSKCLSTSGNLMTEDHGENLEHWNRIRICRGHNLDVVGLAWAPDDSHLVSCSLDSDAPICVWKMNHLSMEHGQEGSSQQQQQQKQQHQQQQYNSMIMQPYKVLGVKEHTSTVKGVAFDPAGKYIVSSGDDPAICIFRAFDDWGLEQRIDATSGIFQQDVQSLANLSMFRRISFSPDGTHVCATNAMVRKKNIAAMVGRSGWGVSAKKIDVSSAANLVGHKQPVVSSRHCPFLFEKKDQPDNSTEDTETEPEYSTLVALGDKKGFVTIWSTKKSRPIFKLQCSENRSAVTDIAWGFLPSAKANESRSLIMMVSLLDGFTVALKFNTEEEIGHLLSEDKKNRIFRLKYGIDLTSLNGMGMSRKRLVDDSSGPKLIENVIQFELEDNGEDMNEANDAFGEKTTENGSTNVGPQLQPINTTLNVRRKEKTTADGKKRIQPVLMSAGTNKVQNHSSTSVLEQRMNGSPGKRKIDSGENFGSMAQPDIGMKRVDIGVSKTVYETDHIPPVMLPLQEGIGAGFLSASNRKVYTADLICIDSSNVQAGDITDGQTNKMIVSCMNSIQNPPGSHSPVSCATISISRGSKVSWRDHLMGANCTALDACSSFIALGSYDGSIYLFSSSQSLGWSSGMAFRSHAPIVMNGSIIRLSLKEMKCNTSGSMNVEMVVVTSDGSFGVYSIVPCLKLQYRGTIIPPMNQMKLSITHRSGQNGTEVNETPDLARIVFTDTHDLLLVLCHKTKNIPVGGILNGFVYNRDIEAWMRISDARFKYSKLFSTISTSNLSQGYLSKIDQVVHTISGTTGISHRVLATNTSASEMYFVNEDDERNLQSFSTRAHCEDRMACAIALRSKEDFEHWLRLYTRILVAEGDSDVLRVLTDMLLGKDRNNGDVSECWWMYPSVSILGLNRTEAVQKIIIPEMTKNRSLQRLTNEIITDISSM